MIITFDKHAILEYLKNIEVSDDNYKCRIYDHGEHYLTAAEQSTLIEELINKVHALTMEDIIVLIGNLRTKSNGKLSKKSTYNIAILDIADYVTDFTNQWYHDRLVIRALAEDEVIVDIENTQTTN